MERSLIDEKLYSVYLDHLISGNKAECSKIVYELIHQEINLKDLYLNLFQRSLYEVGAKWECNDISVATEHLATSITSRLMSLAYPLLFSTRKNGNKVIVSAIANEYHEIGGRMVADLLEMKGWDSYFLGANTPVSELIELIDEKKPSLVALSVAVYMNVGELDQAIQNITKKFPELPIAIGGQAFSWGGEGQFSSYRNCKVFKDMSSFENHINSGIYG